MPLWNNYLRTQTIVEALTALRDSPAPVRPVAGGTDLLLEMQQGHHTPVQTLVDVSAIAELSRLEVRDSTLLIGAGVDVCRVSESPLVGRHAQAVAEACSLIGGPQVRNTATLGGNVAHALPAADGMIALVALDAQAHIASLDGDSVVVRSAPILSLFRGPGLSTLVMDREILVAFTIETIRPGQASAFRRIMRPQGVALPILNIAVWLERSGDRITQARVAIGPSGPVPRRAQAVEAVLTGAGYTTETIECARAALARTGFRSSAQRASAAYRHHLIGDLFEQALNTAWSRALAAEGEER